MKILITGSNGYLGAKLFADLKSIPEFQVYGTYLSSSGEAESELVNQFLFDVTQEDQAINIFEAVKPDAVIHTAAVAHGEAAEDFLALKNVNVKGTENVVKAAQQHNSRFMYISSVAALSSSTDYGTSKLKGEVFVKNSFLDYTILRPAVIIGFSPNRDPDIMFNNFVESVLQNRELVVDSEWKFQPSFINQISEIVMAWLKEGFTDPGPIYPVVAAVKSRFEIAEDILSHFGLHAKGIANPRYPDNEVIGMESLKRNNLQIYTYNDVLSSILKRLTEIKETGQFA